MGLRALGLLSAVLLGLGVAGAGTPAAAQDPAPPEEAPEARAKLPTAHMLLDTSIMAPLERRLAAHGMEVGDPILIRIFKAEAELELWVKVGGRYELFAIYPVCNWSGTLGPKLAEGDKQSPEGLYTVGRRQLHYSARWRRSLDLGFPNAFDRSHSRTGSYILLHGGCTSTGCFAMTDPAMDEIFRLSKAALKHGQKRIHVHAFPFRMTAENMAEHADSPWSGFWANLKEAYDLFERTRSAPVVSVCNRRYVIREAGTESSPCRVDVSATEAPKRDSRAGRAAKGGRQRHALQKAGQRRLAR